MKLVEEVGADQFSLREAARLVGVSANAAYRHFADRSELPSAVAEVGFSRMERRLFTSSIEETSEVGAIDGHPGVAAEVLEVGG